MKLLLLQIIKCLKYIQRYPLSSLFTFLVPSILVTVLVFFRAYVARHVYPNPFSWPSYSPYSFSTSFTKIAYFPKNNFTNELLDNISIQHIKEFVPFNSSREIENLFKEDSTEYICGILFDEKSSYNLLKYTLRFPTLKVFWQTDRLYPEFIHSDTRTYDDHGDPPNYYASGFIFIQSHIDRAFYSLTCNSAKDTENYLQYFKPTLRRMPFPPNIDDRFTDNMDRQISFFVIIALSAQIAILVKYIIAEKKDGIKELFSIYGTSNSTYWFAWLIVYTLFYSLSYTLFSIILKLNLTNNGPILRDSNFGCLLLIFFLNTLTMVSFGIFISTIFNSSVFGGNVTGIIIFSLNILNSIIQTYSGFISVYFRILLSLIPTVNLYQYLHTITGLESAGVGLQWEYFNKPLVPGDDLYLSYLICVSLVSSFVLIILTNYISIINPGQHGNPKPFHFPVSCLFKYFYAKNKVNHDDNEELINNRIISKNHEDDPMGLCPGIEIKNLTKVYPGKGRAVSNINLNIYENQITVLLGHNGAGKTTTLSMITGFLEVTSGQAKIYGHDISKERDVARQHIGFCPQNNLLINNLTVAEHFWLFGLMKGIPLQDINQAIDKTLEELCMLAKRNINVNNLSGGYKRRVCIGIAMIGNSRAVILDEPTCGLDPEARRQIVDILSAARRHRTIFVTTHFLDEADYLADRIAILMKGQIRCSGTPLFLKSKFGDGYNLTFVKGEDFDQPRLMELVERHIPTLRVISNLGDELTLALENQYRSRFPDLFDELEDAKESIGILSFGISISDLEEIFFKFAESDGIEDDQVNRQQVQEYLEINDSDNEGEGTIDETNVTIPGNVQTPLNNKEGPLTEVLGQLSAMLWKKLIHSRRNIFLTLTQFLVPILFTLIAIFLNRYITQFVNTSTVNLNLNISPYTHSNQVHITGQGLETSNYSRLIAEQIMKSYEAQFVHTNNVVFERFTNLSRSYVENLLNIPKEKTQQAYITKYLLGISPTYDEEEDTFVLTSFFQAETLHGQPIAMNTLSNMILDHLTKSYLDKDLNNSKNLICPNMRAEQRVSPAKISVSNHPLKMTTKAFAEHLQTIEHLARQIAGSFPFYVNLLVGFSYLICSQIISVVHEVQTKAKHLQLLSGVKFSIYWMSNFIVDYVWYFIVAGISISLFVMMQADDYAEHPYVLSVLYLLYGFSGLAQNYYLSRFFVNPSSATIMLTTLSIVACKYQVYNYSSFHIAFIGLFLQIILVNPSFGDQDIAPKVVTLFQVLFPSFNFSHGVLMVYFNSKFKKLCDRPEIRFLCNYTSVQMPCCFDKCGKFCAYWSDNFFMLGWNGIGSHCICMTCQFVFFIALVIFLDSSLAPYFTNTVDKGLIKIRVILIRLKRCIRLFFKWKSKKLTGKSLDRGITETNQDQASISMFQDVSHSMYAQTTTPDDTAVNVRRPLESHLIAPDEPDHVDLDVKRQRAHVEAITNFSLHSENNLVIRDVSKRYSRPGFVLCQSQVNWAVKNMFLTVKSGECFGLLGVNGAGKTTTFKMITGDLEPTIGDIYIDNIDLRKDIRKAQSHLGYCPQFDALLTYMTGRENVLFFGKLKKIPITILMKEMNNLFKHLGLLGHENKIVSAYSGGMKRKLSLIIALMGNNSLICLDEPTSGVDPASRRLVWRVILKYLKRGKTIILTSHSMEECEALCSRLCIMVNGRMQCLGSCQHLKNRFGRGYTITLKLHSFHENLMVESFQPNSIDKINDFFANQFPGSKLLETCENVMKFNINTNDNEGNKIRISDIFRRLEENQNSLKLENFTINQTTLEHVFIDFAKQQND